MGISATRSGVVALVGVWAFGVGLAPCAAQGVIAGGFRVGSPAVGGVVTSVPVGGNPWGGYGAYVAPDPYGGYLRGAADVINANGQYLINTQNAFQIKEQTRSMMIDNKRRIFDEWLYERANTPTLEDDRERAQREAFRRAMNDPPQTEIWSGYTLNELLRSAQQLQIGAPQRNTIPVEPWVLSRLNVTSGRGNGGLLRDGGRLTWPSSIQDLVPAAETERLTREVQTQFQKAVDDTRSAGQPGPGVLRAVRQGVTDLRDLIRRNSLEMTTAAYSDARRYLEGIEQAARALDSPNAASVLNTLRPQGHTVGEVVQFMTQNGLQFAPAATGDEAAYNAMQRLLVAYNSTILMASSGPRR